jgi:hypothetical protein
MSERGGPIGDFDAFVKGQQHAALDGGPENWESERVEWLRYLEELYKIIESFLAEYIASGDIKRDYREITLNEENIGSYTARQMILKIGGREITLTPVGTFIFGAKGRVDVAGTAGQFSFLLVDSEASRPQFKATVSAGGKPDAPAQAIRRQIKWAWKIASSEPLPTWGPMPPRAARIQYIELTRESLFPELMAIANAWPSRFFPLARRTA